MEDKKMIDRINHYLTVYCNDILRGQAIIMLEDLIWVKNLRREELIKVYNNWRKTFIEPSNI